MFEIGWSEILILAVVALIVVGPKDLPVLLRTVGRFVGMAKRQIGAFRAELDAAVSSSDLDLVHKEMEAIRLAADQEVDGARRSLKAPARPSDRQTLG